MLKGFVKLGKSSWNTVTLESSCNGPRGTKESFQLWRLKHDPHQFHPLITARDLKKRIADARLRPMLGPMHFLLRLKSPERERIWNRVQVAKIQRLVLPNH